MKIVLINSVCGYGSTGRIMVDLAKTYMQEGHQCILAYGRGEVSKDVKKLMKKEYPGQCVFYRIGGKFAKINNYIHGFESRLLDNHGFSSRIATRQFIEWLQQEKPDVIHLHNLHGYYINIEMLFQYIKRSHVKVVWTLHDCWSFTGHCSYYEYANCDKWKKECNHCPQKREYPDSMLLDRSTENYNRKKSFFTGVKDMTIVTPSRWLKNQVQQSFLKEYPVEVVPNGIDLKNFYSLEKREEKNKYTVLGVANIWDKRKGLKYFFSLAKELTKNYKIILIGLNENQLRILQKKQQEFDYLQKIKGIQRTDSIEQLVEYYQNADVFVNPTLEDNFPTTNLEAIACGTPVVTFETGGSPECLNSECGIVVKKGDKNELCKAVRFICEKKGKCKGINRNAFVNQAMCYDKDRCGSAYVNIVKSQ